MIIKTKYRTEKAEIMDNFNLEGETLRDALDKIAKINKFLGGNRLTLSGVEKLIKDIPAEKEITIVDVGCGNGDMLRVLADYGLKKNLKLQLIGIDANKFTINYAKDLSRKYSNINYRCEDIFDKPFKKLKYDILLSTLVLHHFKEKEIIGIMNLFYTNSGLGVIINDLQRNAIAYRLFQFVCFVFGLSEMNRNDGLISILRGFKKEELIQFSEKLNFKKYSIKWKWAFRYQWIISKI